MAKLPGSKYDSGNKSFRVQVTKKQKQLEALMRAVPIETKAILNEIGSESKDEMQRIIKNSESDFGALRRSYGIGKGSGRYDTGAMHDDVTYVTEQATDRISVRVGWLKRFQEYYGFQEIGFKQLWKTAGFNFLLGRFEFTRRKSPVHQEGIHALRDARMMAREKLNDMDAKIYHRLLSIYNRGGK